VILFVAVTLVVGACLLAIPVWLLNSRSFGSDRTWGRRLLVVALVSWVALTAFFGWLSFGTEDTITVRFEGKERIAEGDGGKWMFYAEGGETFENTDAWYHGKSDSTNLYRAVALDTTYRCEVNGVRFTLLSMYRNVLSCERA
jgi:hypothetical protein